MNIKFFSSNKKRLLVGLVAPACFLSVLAFGLAFLSTVMTEVGVPFIIRFLITITVFTGGIFLVYYYITHSSFPLVSTYQREVKRVYGIELSQTALQASQAPSIQPTEEEKQYNKFSNDDGTVYSFKWVNGNLILTDKNYQELKRVN